MVFSPQRRAALVARQLGLFALRQVSNLFRPSCFGAVKEVKQTGKKDFPTAS